MQTIAIILAAGRGVRAADGAGGDTPKQYRRLGGAPVLTHAMAAIAAHPGVGKILTVIAAADRDRYADASRPFADRLLPAVEGGERRQDSVRKGLEALVPHAPRDVLIHDAARPFASLDVIDRVMSTLQAHQAVVPGCSVTDTLKRARDGLVSETVDRADLWRAQTPQGFRYPMILDAHRHAAAAARYEFTDDAAIAQWHGAAVTLVEGDQANRKLTTREDFALASRLLADGADAQAEWRTGQGFDVHAFVEGDHLMLCGVRIAYERALAGHSDADVGLHALTDAVLGTIGDGDIGAHFPPDDPRWKDSPSHVFLRDAVGRVVARGGRLMHLDVTLICEAPKIAPHRDAMRACVAGIVGLERDRVSVKATTTEGLGFTGRREGIAALATATVRFR